MCSLITPQIVQGSLQHWTGKVDWNGEKEWWNGTMECNPQGADAVLNQLTVEGLYVTKVLRGQSRIIFFAVVRRAK